MPEPGAGSLVLFFVLAYAGTWALFWTVALTRPPGPIGAALILLGAFCPAFAALAVTAGTEGRAGVRRLLHRLTIVQVPGRCYAFALLFMPAVKLSVAVLHRGVTGTWPQFGREPPALIPLAILFSMPFQAGEEIGWRGFALPRLASRLSLGPASLVLGVIWAVWHLPQFFIIDADTYGQSFYVFSIEVVAISVVFTWLLAEANGSLLLVMLLHAAINNSKDIVPSAQQGAHDIFSLEASAVLWLTCAVLWIVAAHLLLRMRGRRLSLARGDAA
jgi:uncharacterized protein